MSCFQFLGIISAGDCGGKSENILNTNILSEAISKTVQEASTTVGNTTISNQTQTVQINDGPHAFCCANMDISQTANVQVVYTTTAINNLVGQISQTFQNNIDASLSASQANKKGLLAGSDTSQMASKIKNAVKNYFESEQGQNTITSTLNKTIGNQSQTLQINCPKWSEILQLPEVARVFQGLPKDGSQCKINQDFRLNLAATTCVKNVLESIQIQNALADIASTLESTQKNKGEGLADLWAIFIILGVVVVIAIVGFVIWSNTKGGQSVLESGRDVSFSRSGVSITGPSLPKASIKTLTDYIPRF